MQDAPSLKPGERSPTPAPRPVVRLLVDHFWLLAVPLYALAFRAMIEVGNRVDLEFLVWPRAAQAAAAAAIVAVLMGLPYLLLRGEFDRAREDLALERDARLGVKDARRRLRHYGSRLTDGQRAQMEATIARVEAALPKSGDSNGTGDLGQAVTELEGRLEEHLGFGRKGPAREYAESIGVAVFIALVLRAFVVEAFKIPSGSMIPTLQVGDHIFVSKFIYGVRLPWTNIKLGSGLRPPRRGEVVVFVFPKEPDKDFIKRIIAVPGDEVDVKGDQVYINGKPLPRQQVPGKCSFEDYDENSGVWHSGECEAFRETDGEQTYTTINDARSLGRGGGMLQFPIKVPARSVFVMGDNRDNSHDSRYWGFVPYDLIKGKAAVIWWSTGKGNTVRTDRMFTWIHP